MAVTFCPHCEVPLTKEEERGRRCPACKKSLRAAPERAEPPEDAASFVPTAAPKRGPRTWAVSAVAVLVVLTGIGHVGAGIFFTITLEAVRAEALEPRKVTDKNGNVKEYPPDGYAAACANFCIPILMVFTVGLVVVGGGLILIGLGLWRRRRWARIATFIWLCLVIQPALLGIVGSNEVWPIVIGVAELVIAIGSLVILYRNRAEFGLPPREPVEDED